MVKGREVQGLILLTLVAFVSLAEAQEKRPSLQNNRLGGPRRGTLLLQGGVGDNQEIDSAFRAFAGGAASHIVVIPTASVGDAGPPGMNEFLARRNKARFGVGAVTVLHSLDRETADSDRFVEALRAATGVWILGGFPPLLVRTYLGTKTERAINELLDRGGVVGGESAGAMIQASWLDTSDDEFTPDIRALIRAHGRSGFGLLNNVAVFPHFDRRGSGAAVRFSADYPGQVGIGIDEGTALIVKDGRFSVIGRGAVTVYDGRRQAAKPILLKSGDHYKFATRK